MYSSLLEQIPLAPSMPETLPVGRESPWLAPLAGYSDLPFRLLCREYGAACCVTEMVSAKGLHYKGQNTAKLLASSSEDAPLVVQLFGSQADILGEAVSMLRDRGYEWFDLNMGCSVPKVAKQGAGSAMLKDPENALACAKAMIASAKPKHVSFKLRLGVTHETENWLETALRLEEAGAFLICLHPRTASDGFRGEARWEELAKAKESLSIPVLASGDLFSAEDGMRCLDQTGVDGLMYARGALVNPGIFSIHKDLARGAEARPRTKQDLKEMIRRHVELICQCNGIEKAVRGLKSIVPRYVRSLPGVKELRQRLCACESLDELGGVLDLFLEGEDVTLQKNVTSAIC